MTRYLLLALFLSAPLLALACTEKECEASEDCPEVTCDGATLQVCFDGECQTECE